MDRPDGAGRDAGVDHSEGQRGPSQGRAIPEVVERFETLGTYTRDLTPAQTGEFIRSEERLWWPIVRQVNQKR
jgi:hypothetical protein